jgi:hypothetical protein
MSFINAWAAGGSEWAEMTCPSCGVRYALTEAYRATKATDEATWHCPNGHSLHYPRTESVEQRELREAKEALVCAEQQRDDATRAREWAESRAKGANIAAGKAKAAQRRLVARVAYGVCPCCQRTFKQLAAHMKSKHPGVGEGGGR